MRLIPVGLGVVAALQVVAAAAAYPILSLAVALAASLYQSMAGPEAGAGTILFVAGLPMAIGALVMGAVFVVVPLAVSAVGARVVGGLGRRRGATVSTGQLLKFGAAVIVLNLAVLVAGVLIWPVWGYSEKLASLMPLWPLVLSFVLNAALDSAVAAITLRSRLRTR